MAKKRAKVDQDLFEGKSDLFKKTEEEEKEKQKEEPRVDLRGRATYQIGIELKEAIKDESNHIGVPASQLAKYLLLFAWDDYLNGRIPPPTLLDSDSPAYQHNIDFGD